uniref:Uncharacterized protein LOC114349025 n=1 Tax=Diabrotica virgifera virgifera TaxID=50390 RepID=A0A6P7H131_DIAVI
MISSPVKAILAECNELPLDLRRQLLSQKYLLKLKSLESNMINKLSDIAKEDLTNRFWKIKNSPPLAEAFVETNADHISFGKNKTLFMYTIPYRSLIKPHRVIIPNYTEYHHINHTLLKSILGGLVNKPFIYTDGSKTKHGVGCGVFIQNTKQSFMFKLPSICSIYTAELIAIWKGITWLTSNNLRDGVILTDSKSALESIKR